ncbi:hypothetical protein J6590_056307 [Homalodisca vitripennis]|nr:hypothetical protein J6590_056307 [Homalodisca vitripennis]
MKGDSHTRHVTGLVRDSTSSAFSVGGMYKPGAWLLNIVNPGTTSPESGRSCDVLNAGTNDMAVGEQQCIYHHLESYIIVQPAGAELTTLPYSYDLDPDHPIHEETMLVNSFIEELAARHHTRLPFFTRHGQHLSITGKQLLAGMIVECLIFPRHSPPTPAMPAQPSHPMRAPVMTTTSATVSAPATAPEESATRQQHITYAEAVGGSPVAATANILSFIDPMCSRWSKLMNQIATNKMDEIQLKIKKQMFVVVTKNGNAMKVAIKFNRLFASVACEINPRPVQPQVNPTQRQSPVFSMSLAPVIEEELD